MEFKPVLSHAHVESLGHHVLINMSCAVVIIKKVHHPEPWPISQPHSGLKLGFCI